MEGKIKIKIASTGSQEEIISVPSRTLLLQLVQAADLHCESSFDSVNAFVKVYWDNSFVGESLTISRSQSPIWNQLFRLQMPDASDVASQCSLYIELWSRNRITQNVFLGAVEITYKDFLWASECEGSSLAWFALKSSSRRPLPHTSKKSATQGKVELGFFPGTYSELSIEKSLLSVRRIRNDDAEASISINRVYPDVSELRTVTSEYNRLRDQDVGKGALELSISSFYPCFAQRAVFRITQKLRLIVQSRDSDEDGRWVEEPILIDLATLEESPIMISLVGLNQSGAELVLGILHVTSDILLLHAPFEANFLMLKSTNLTADVTIRMSARFRFDYWSCLGSRPVQGSLIKRRIQLISCKDLAIVNGAVPRVVCLAVQGERIIHTSPAQESCHPFWTGCSFDAEVDESSGQTVSIQVMHLDADLESRICIGTCEVPFRSFIRLSELPIDLVLAPLSSSKDSDFLVSGTVRILITVAVQGHTTTEPYFSRSKQKVTPKSLETNDFSVSKLLGMGDIIVSAVDSRRLFIALDVSAKGSLHAFSILRKRPYRFKPCSPFNKIKAAIKACIFKLEGREKSAHLRAANLHSFRDLLTTNSICSQEDSQWILAQLLLRSFPLCTCFIASMSPDRSTVHYTRYQDGKSSFFSLKYRFISGSVPTFTFPTSSCLAYEKYSDLQKTLFVTFGPFEKSIFPCIAVPFSANDGDAGFFGMDQLGFYSGESDTNLADVEIIKQWFLDVGNCFYRASLTRIEAEINERILSYLSRHNASYEGLFRKIAEQSLVFLPHCKLIEVWSLNSTNDLRSLVFAKPEPDVVAPGVEVIIKNLHIANVHGPQGVEHLMDSLQLVVYFEYRGTSQCHCISGRQRKDWTLNRETLIILDEADLRVNLRVSEVSEDLSVLQEYSGFLDFQMSAPEFIFCTLKDLTTGIVTHSVKASLLWPRPVELQGVLVNLNSIRSFTLTIHRASSLLSQHRVLNPFCEVYWESKLIYRTVVRENTRNPVWEQHFELPYSTGSSSIVIDVYHMTFIKRDTFLGRIEIPFTDCCFHSTFARQVSLEQTAALHPSCQKFVGGSLTYSTVVNKFGPRNGHEVEIAMSGNDHSNLLSVTVDSCAGLMKADLIGERRPFIIGIRTVACQADYLFHC